jgi:hypothetical protein
MADLLLLVGGAGPGGFVLVDDGLQPGGLPCGAVAQRAGSQGAVGRLPQADQLVAHGGDVTVGIGEVAARGLAFG